MGLKLSFPGQDGGICALAGPRLAFPGPNGGILCDAGLRRAFQGRNGGFRGLRGLRGAPPLKHPQVAPLRYLLPVFRLERKQGVSNEAPCIDCVLSADYFQGSSGAGASEKSGAGASEKSGAGGTGASGWAGVAGWNG